MLHVIEPVRPIPVFTYRCDSKFHTDVLKEMLQDTEKYGFIVVDGNGVLFATLSGNTSHILCKYQVSLPKKHRRGGQSAGRFFRLRLEARHNYLTKVTELATKCFVDPSTNKVNVSGIVLAGAADFKDQLSANQILDPRVQASVVACVDVAYGFNQGLYQAIELSSNILKNVSLVHQKKLLARFFSEIAQDTEKTCFGVADTMNALESGGAETLLVWDRLDIVRTEVVCKETGQKRVLFRREKQEQVKQEPSAKEVTVANGKEEEQTDTEEERSSQLLVDWLAEHHQEMGAKLEIVHDASPQGSQFCRGFGGIGALLRYRMTFASTTDGDNSNHSGNNNNANTGKEEEDDDARAEDEEWAAIFEDDVTAF